MKPLTITITSVPLSLNNIYRTKVVKGVPIRVLTGPANRWKTTAALEMRSAAARQRWQPIKKQPLRIDITYSAPNILQWDIDGKPKLLLDAFCAAFGLDDRYVMELSQVKQRAPIERVDMTITPL